MPNHTTPRLITALPDGRFIVEDRLFRAADGTFYKCEFSPTLNPTERLPQPECVALAQACAIDPEGGAWDAPEVFELAAIADYSRTAPAVPDELKGDISEWFYWSKTGFASGSSYAWGALFNYGLVSANHRSSSGFVRAVRRVPASQS